jgi:hypothetical protein
MLKRFLVSMKLLPNYSIRVRRVTNWLKDERWGLPKCENNKCVALGMDEGYVKNTFI